MKPVLFLLPLLVTVAACVGTNLESDRDPDKETNDNAQALGAVAPDGTTPFGGTRWPGGRIPYVIDDGTLADAACGGTFAGKPFDAHTQGAITTSIDEYNALLSPNVRFVPLESSDTGPFVLFARAKPPSATNHNLAAAATRGMPPAGANCVTIIQENVDKSATPHAILHELGHVLGAVHEQQRADRKEFVTVHSLCSTGDAKIFGKFADTVLVGPYDYASLMDYPSYSDCRQTPDCTNPVTGECIHPVLLKKIDCSPKLAAFGVTGVRNNTDCRWLTLTTDLSVHDVNGFLRMYEKPLGTSNMGDEFGRVMATGDFDGDGMLDLAVAAPHDDGGAGAVYLFKGSMNSSASPATVRRLVAWKRLSPADWATPPSGTIYSVGSDHTEFGASLAAGDFDGDGKTDLAIGAPGASIDGGAAYLYHSRIVNQGVRTFEPYNSFTETSTGVAAETSSRFGAALASGDFLSVGYDQLVVAAPTRRVGSARAGQIFFLWPNERAHWASLVPSDFAGVTNLDGAHFGAALLARDFDLDGIADLVIGSPDTDTGRAGAIYFARGVAHSPPMPGQTFVGPTSNAQFGSALAAGNFDSFTHGTRPALQLAVGAPGYQTAGNVAIGEIIVYQAVWGATFDWREQITLRRASPENYDGFGTNLAAGRLSLLDANDALIVGMPNANADNGAVKVFPNGTRGPSTFTNGTSACAAGTKLGSAVAVGSLINTLAGQVIVGCTNASGGAVHLGNAATDGALTWLAKFRQETASPE